ncbi:hypothetical protein C2G38_2190913 [Gigaspora rosea]|uniref:Uncharacterized protein n=1 Tax=Gigaspora rosea TaxID=44941 RepID=A0A397V419_9GLOM|nr:hypothetical protein C2G38_2190913 [Gigaspora rosea]
MALNKFNKKELLNIESQSENFETTNNNFKEIDNEFEYDDNVYYSGEHELVCKLYLGEVQEENCQEI